MVAVRVQGMGTHTTSEVTSHVARQEVTSETPAVKVVVVKKVVRLVTGFRTTFGLT